MPYVDTKDVPAMRVPKPCERDLKVVMSPETHDDVEGFTLLVSTLAPEGGCTDFHTHDVSGELMYFTSGEGKAWLAGKEYVLKPNVAIYAPPGVEHKTMNTGKEPLQIVCVFVPPAPADYIRQSISAAAKPEGGNE